MLYVYKFFGKNIFCKLFIHSTSIIFHRITQEKFLDLTQEIKELFPDENVVTFYLKGVTMKDAKGNTRKRKPSGLLYRKYLNSRFRLYQQSGVLRKEAKGEKKNTSGAYSKSYCFLRPHRCLRHGYATYRNFFFLSKVSEAFNHFFLLYKN